MDGSSSDNGAEESDGPFWPHRSSSVSSARSSLGALIGPQFEFDLPSVGGVTLAWKELSVYVPLPKPGFFKTRPRHRPIKRVINNAAGIVTPGSLLAIMGASGSGKTTLMNVLAYKLAPDVCIDGEILVNGSRIGKGIATVSGYMYQDDLFFETLTVSEHLQFMARMKLDRRLGTHERKRRIEELLNDLSLKKSVDTRISDLSGGERKRLSFATEILTDPPILFCDEPTTGLDSFSAQNLVGIMRRMAAGGKTILCTIHQPSSQIFTMFDQVLLIADGRTAFMGRREQAPEFFGSLGYICPECFNPADFYIQKLALRDHEYRTEAQRVVKHICDTYATSSAGQALEDALRIEFKDFDSFDFRAGSAVTSTIHQSILEIQSSRNPRWLTKTSWLFWRAFLDSIRNPKIHYIRTIQKIVLALLIGLSFFGVGAMHSSQIGIQNIQGAIFLFITESTYPIMYGVLHTFPVERPVFLREVKGHLYPVNSYYLAKILSLIPGFILDPFIFITIAYWLVGFKPTVEAFSYTVLIVILTSNAAAACGCLFSAAFDNVSSAFTFLCPFDFALFVAAGILINLDSLPLGIRWIKYLSWFTYSNEGISISQWDSVTDIACDVGVDSPCFRTGEDVLSSYSFSSSHFLQDIIGLTSLIVFFHILAFITLLIKTRTK